MATARDNLARQQIYIPATQPEEEIVLGVAAYCRVSTDSEDQINSFIAQNNHYTEVITAHDRWELVDIYADMKMRKMIQFEPSLIKKKYRNKDFWHGSIVKSLYFLFLLPDCRKDENKRSNPL